MRIDLHVHTTASDGAHSPEQVVRDAVAGGLDVLSITDHDTAGGVAPALAAAAGSGLVVVSGTELSSTWDGHDIHILGYGIDPGHPGIEAHRTRARRIRLERMQAMIERLEGEGVEVTLDEVLAEAGPGGEMVGRPHLARALVARGAVGEMREAFDRYIADHGPAFVPTSLQDPGEAVATIRRAGGIAVWAHPPRDRLDDLLPLLVDAGLGGIEVHRPHNGAGWTRTLLNTARSHGLLVSGGSDWHNPERNAALGSWWVTPGQVRDLLDALGVG